MATKILPWNAKDGSGTSNYIGLNKKGLKLFHLNIHFLLNKLDELKCKILSNTPRLDVCGFTETFLSDIVTDDRLQVAGYNLHRKDRKSKIVGGVVVYTSDKWKVIRRADLEIGELESIWLEFIIPMSKSVFVCYIYRPPKSQMSWFDEFDLQILSASKYDSDIIILGDFNIDFMPGVMNSERKRWNETILLNNFTQVIDEPTRVTSSTETIIDHIYVNNIKHVQEIAVPKISLSDHYGICMTYKKSSFQNSISNFSNVITYHQMKNFNNYNFLYDLNNTCMYHHDETVSVNSYVETFTNNFILTLDKHAPTKLKRIKNKVQPKWFNDNIRKCIFARDKEKRKGKMIVYRNLINQVVNMVRMAKEKYYQDILKTNKGNTKVLWQEMKSLTGNKPKKYPSSLHVDNDTICSDLSEIAEHLNLYFTQIAENIIKTKVNPNNYCEYEPPTPLKEFVNSKIPKKGGFIIPKVTDIQVGKLLKSLNLSKANGMDKISAKFVQMATPALVHPLCYIMNTSIETGTFPDLWKHAKVHPIFKSGDAADMNNYRPISILTILSKLLESHVHDTFYSYLCSYDWFSQYTV